jgi:hypothetical protein
LPRQASPGAASAVVAASVMLWKPNDEGYVSIMAGSFEESSSLVGGYHIFIADKGSYYEVDDDLPRYERSSPSLKVLED